jgi:hypothetical protein
MRPGRHSAISEPKSIEVNGRILTEGDQSRWSSARVEEGDLNRKASDLVASFRSIRPAVLGEVAWGYRRWSALLKEDTER